MIIVIIITFHRAKMTQSKVKNKLLADLEKIIIILAFIKNYKLIRRRQTIQKRNGQR
jgi:hypothetical protein